MAAVSTAERVTTIVAELGGLAILAGTLAAFAAFVYRWYVREAIPRGLSLLVGLSAVAVYLNTTTALGQVIGGTAGPTDVQAALFNIAAFAVAAGGAAAGRRAGDRFGVDVFVQRGFSDIESDVGKFVRSVGRVTAVELPDTIDDVVGYDPVPDETREALAGKTFLFPRRLTVEQLRERLTTRLKTDYAVGHVDVELADDGSVEYLALGSRAAGIGPTLPPATNAVAIRADPAFAASAGDLVQVWETDPMRRVLTAELRGVADDTVTVAIDAADTPKIDPRKEYRLVTLPVSDRPDREFASLLRAADETFSSVTVEAGSPLHGMPVGSLDLALVSIQPETGDSLVLPDPEQVLAPGDTVFAIARPEELRRLETAAEPLDPSLVRRVDSPSVGRSEPVADASGSDSAAETAATTSATVEPTGGSDGHADDADGTAEPTEPGDSPPATGTVAADDDTADESDSEGGQQEEEQRAEGEDPIDGRADTNSFQQLKDEFESGDADWADEEGEESDEESDDGTADDDREPVEAAFGDDPSDLGADEGDSADSDAGDLAFDTDDGSEFESDDETGLDLGADDGGELDFGDEDEEELDFEDDDDEGEPDFDFEDEDDTFEDTDDDLEELDFGDDDGDDDLGALDFDEDEDGFSFDEDDGTDAEDETPEGEDDEGGGDEDGDDEDEESDGDESEDEDDDDDDSGGGASSFQQLKEEFESGDADWADDISDSPGGDMRLDE